jgi:hypothetical protein
MKMSYLACPFSNPAQEVRAERMFKADVFAARLTRDYAVFSPITQGPRLEPHLAPSKVKSHSFWMHQCIPLLRKADVLHVLPIDGWRESKGVAEEIALATQMHMPIKIIQAHDHHLEILDVEEFRATGWIPEWIEAQHARGARSHKNFGGGK